MGVKKSASDSKKGQAKVYKEFCKAGKNKALKLARHLKKHPGDAQAAEAVSTAKNHTGRKAPKRTGARLNPYVSERDKIACLDKEHDMFIVSRSLNLLSGRISAAGKRIQEARAFSKGVRNQVAFDPKGKLFPKARLTREERQIAKLRAMGKADSGKASKAKQKKANGQARKAKGPVQKAKASA